MDLLIWFNKKTPLTLLLFILLGLSPLAAREAQSTLTILNTGVQDSEDAPFVGNGFQFLPGEYVYLSFQVAGFNIRTNEEKNTRQISLKYELTPLDSRDVPLAEPAGGEITTQLNPEDKNWVPKRRAAFLLPSFVASGEYRIRIAVKDLQANLRTEKDVAFQIGGLQVQPAATIQIENFRFTRDEAGTQSLTLPAYRPGDPVYSEFDLVGYQFETKTHYHVSYSVKVTGPDGKTFLTEANAANLEAASFYPPQFLPGNLTVTTSKNDRPGQYVVTVTAHDLIGKRDSSITQAFSLEQ